MAFDPSVFEKLGAFYLGRPCDLQKSPDSDGPLLYDSRDLVTHAVCVGMTGSGKTGLCLALLEEAALDGLPAIIIDPKGDLGNLLLTFPGLQPSDFRPWINEEDARRKGTDPDTYAIQQAELWKTGLAAWGQDGNRIRTLREKVDMAIYTPGSTSGIPVNILASFEAPVAADPEALAERVQTTVASLLGLLKIDADPVKSREFLLLSALLTHEWREGNDLDLAGLIERIQNPPFAKIGILDLEVIYPARERFGLVMALNTMLAAPGFATWQQGEPLDIGRFLYTPEGKPRLAIFSVAHLGDDERMFFVSLLLNELLSWTRAQSGTSSLRALLYMDEIFGYLPPTANPPSKLPLLTLLKQARAYGVGVVLATQNPVDLDYKALSNAGTWFIGRLQTERDKARVLDGLQGAAGNGKFDRSRMEALLAGLGNRVFLMNNVHDDAPMLFETRWVMSYLRGPLTRDQIKVLMAGREAAPMAPHPPSVAPPAVPPETSAIHPRPTLPPDVPQGFFPGGHRPFYAPRLLGAASVHYRDRKLGLDYTRDVVLSAPVPEGPSGPAWEADDSLRPEEMMSGPAEGAAFGPLPSAAALPKNYAGWEKDFRRAAADLRLVVWVCPELKTVSRPGESEADFRVRISQTAREHRDAGVETLRKKYTPKLAALQTRLARAEAAVQRQKDQASHAKLQTVISVGSTLLGAFLGRKAISSTTIGKAATAARGMGRSMKEGADVGLAEQSVEAIRRQIAELEADFEADRAALAATEPGLKKTEIKPLRTGCVVRMLVLAWVPG